MTPVLDVNEVVAAGGPARLMPAESDLILAQATPDEVRVAYAAVEWVGSTYVASIAPARPTAVISKTDEGFVAESPELNSLGYGSDERAAVQDLTDSIREYLTFLNEKKPVLGPKVTHHAFYLSLLSIPEQSWFAAIWLPSTPPDAT